MKKSGKKPAKLALNVKKLRNLTDSEGSLAVGGVRPATYTLAASCNGTCDISETLCVSCCKGTGGVN